MNTHTANVFLPGSVGPIRRDVVLAIEAQEEVNAQRLRADTAEAELKELRVLSADQGLNLKRVKRAFDAMKSRAAAAEQRIASHESMLRHFASCADLFQVGTIAMNYVAALNPNPEAESHVS